MKKILYIVSTLQTSGPTKQLYGLVRHLDKGKFNPLVLTLSPEPVRSSQKLFESISVPIHSLNLTRFQGIIKADRKSVV